MTTLRLGTRQSPLAQAQAEGVASRLRSAFPKVSVEIILITTSGDRKSAGQSVNADGGLKALFTKEIEEALLAQEIDLAVHSLKDMSAELPRGLVIGAVPEREDARDVWISKTNLPFKDIPAGARIGTGAIRRQAQLRKLFPQAMLVPLRGNVDTRLGKLNDGSLDGIVLAMAGLKRLGKSSAATEAIQLDVVIPAVGQGCLGIQVREDDSTLGPYLKVLDHPESHAAALAERAFLKTLGGSCQTPIAGHATVTSDSLRMLGAVLSEDGSREIRSDISGAVMDAEKLGNSLAQQLVTLGAGKLLKDSHD